MILRKKCHERKCLCLDDKNMEDNHGADNDNVVLFVDDDDDGKTMMILFLMATMTMTMMVLLLDGSGSCSVSYLPIMMKQVSLMKHWSIVWCGEVYKYKYTYKYTQIQVRKYA